METRKVCFSSPSSRESIGYQGGAHHHTRYWLAAEQLHTTNKIRYALPLALSPHPPGMPGELCKRCLPSPTFEHKHFEQFLGKRGVVLPAADHSETVVLYRDPVPAIQITVQKCALPLCFWCKVIFDPEFALKLIDDHYVRPGVIWKPIED